MLALKTCIVPALSAMVACIAHVRRKFAEIHRSQGNAIVEEAIQQGMIAL